jgi:hypothetical protein
MNNEQTRQAEYPKNTMELLKYIAKKIPERLLKALPMTIAFGVFGWLLHTYLLVFTNEGFAPGTWLGSNILNVSGRLVSSTLLWTMFGAVVPMLISFLRRGGNPIKTIGSIAKMPIDIINRSKTSGSFLPFMCFACGFTLFCETAFSGITSMLAGGIIMSSVVAFVTGRGSIFIQLLRMIVNDIQMFVLKAQKLRLDSESIFMIVGSSGTVLLLFGLLRAFVLPQFLFVIINYIWILLIILGVVLFCTNNKVPKQFVIFIGYLGTAVFFSKVLNITAFADDGGWSESGGTLGGWIRSEGAFQATLSGLPPAIGGLVGSYVATILGGLLDGFGPMDLGAGATPPTQPDIPPVPDVPQQVTPPGQDVPPTQPPPQKETPEQLAARLKQEAEQERIRQQFEAKRQLEIEKQKEARTKALEELKLIQQQKAERQKYIDRLCKKYNTTPDKLRNVIQGNMDKGAADAKAWDAYDKNLAYAEAAAKITLVAADTAIDGLANITGPVGKQVRAGYKVVKGTAAGAAEAYATNKSITAGAASGLVKGGADAASDYIDSTKVKAGLAVGSEVLGGAITDGGEGALNGLKNGVYNVGVGAITDKLGGGGYGNDVALVNQLNGKTAVIINAGGQTITKIVSNNSAANFIQTKLINQGIQSGVKGASGLINEMVVKPALTSKGYLPS